MSDISPLPRTLQEAILYFQSPDVAHNFATNLRWPEGVFCPHCDSKSLSFVSTRRIWKCKNKICRKQFSMKVGTIMEDSPIGLDKWLAAIWMIANAKNGISSYEIHRALGITQKSAWFVLHRIRLAMQTGTFERLSGRVEADETYIGGKARNMHKEKRKRKITGTGSAGKTIVMGLLEREGRVRTKVISDTQRTTLQPEVRRNLEKGSELFTDAHSGYKGLNDEYIHQVIDHALAYVNGHIHTNGMENFWSLLKRTLKGTYISVEPFHLFRYLDEQAFRFNNRKDSDSGRFLEVMKSLSDRRLTYKEVTGKTLTA